MFLCPARSYSNRKWGTYRENLVVLATQIEKEQPLWKQNKSYRRLAACKICFVLRAKYVTQSPRVSYRDRDVLYRELTYYSGCPPPEFHL